MVPKPHCPMPSGWELPCTAPFAPFFCPPPPPQRREKKKEGLFTHHRTYPEIGSGKAVGGRDVGGGGGVGIVSVDVGQQGAHHCRHPRAHVFGGQASKVPGGRSGRRAACLGGTHWEWGVGVGGDVRTRAPRARLGCKGQQGSKGLTSWPGRWIPPHSAWQTHPRSPVPSHQSKPSRRRPLWRRGSSPRRCFVNPSRSGKGSGGTDEGPVQLWARGQHSVGDGVHVVLTSCRHVYCTW